MADGATFEIDIRADGSQALAAADAVSLVTDRLTASAAASTAAADAVKVGQAAYAQTESAANRTAIALEKVTLAAQAQAGKVQAALDVGDLAGAERAKAKLDALTSKQSELAAKSNAAKAALDAEAATLDRLKGAATQTATAQQGIAKELDRVKAAQAASNKAAQAASGSGKVNEIAEGLGKLGGPLGSAGQKAFGAAEGFKKLGASLGAAGPYVAIGVALVAMAASLGAVAVAAGIAAVKMTLLGVANAEAGQTQLFAAEAMLQSTKGASDLVDSMSAIRAATGLAPDKINELTKGLIASGLRGKALSDALEVAAHNTAKLTLGPNYEKRLLQTGVQAELLKENLGKTFSVSTKALEPFQKALATLGPLFSTQTASGRAMQVVFQDLTSNILGAATDAIPKLRTNFIAAEIAILKGLIQLKLFTQQYGDKMLFAAQVVGILSAVIIGGLVLALVFVAVNLAIIGAGLGLAIALIAGLAAGVVYAANAVGQFGASIVLGIVGSIQSAVTFLQSVSLSDIGTAMIDGLVNGITASAAKVVTALKGVVDGAVKTAKTALGVASPSKVFAEIGGYTAEGMAEGVADGTSDVQSTISDMVAPPDVAAAPVAASGGKADGGGGGIRDINIYGVRGAEDLLEELKLLAIQLGAAVPA